MEGTGESTMVKGIVCIISSKFGELLVKHVMVTSKCFFHKDGTKMAHWTGARKEDGGIVV